MEEWAIQYKADYSKVVFLSLSVHPDIPKEFAHGMAKDTGIENNCHNGYMTRPPPYGQLGCGGFVVLDNQSRFLSPKTPSFMELRGLAFKHVEGMVDWIISERPKEGVQSSRLPRILPGDKVEVQSSVVDTPSSKLPQGASGVCVEVRESGGCKVFLMQSQKMVAVPMEALFNASRKDEPGVNEGFTHSVCTIPRKNPGGCAGKRACAGKSCEKKAPAGQPNFTMDEFDKILGKDEVGKLEHLTKHTALDNDHVSLVNTFREVVAQPTTVQLSKLYTETKAHFDHEEMEFKVQGYGSGRDQFSATRAHLLEHDRLLEEMAEALESPTVPGVVPGPLLKKMVVDFVEHLKLYDSRYAGVVVDSCCAEVAA